MKIIIDNREQKAMLWDKEGDPHFPGLQVEWGTLKTGDYSIKGMDTPDCQQSVCIERKSMTDLFGSTGRGRERLKKEFERMAEFDCALFVIEADLKAIFRDPPTLSQMRPKTVYRTLLAFSQRYGVGIWPCPNRNFAERHTYLALKRFYDDRQPGGVFHGKGRGNGKS